MPPEARRRLDDRERFPPGEAPRQQDQCELERIRRPSWFHLPLAVEGQDVVHRVAPGETLWGIAGQHYAAPWRWEEIYQANRAVVPDPNKTNRMGQYNLNN